MKLLILCLTLFLTIQSFANNYYVATDGNNSNPGTFAQPWLTWDYAFSSSSVNAGDTVFIRGGVYNITVTNGSGYGVTRTGTADNWGVSQDFTSPVTYTVTALDEVTEQEWVVTVTQAEAPSTHPRPVMNGTKPVMYGTKMVIMN